MTRRPFFSGLETLAGHKLLRATPLIAGGVLLIAATAKALQFVYSPLLSPGLQSLPESTPTLIAGEIFLGLWLISGTLPTLARRIAICCFSVFACYAFYEEVSGRASCGCFGQVRVNPLVTAMLDGLIVLALLFWAKPAKGVEKPPGLSRHKWPVVMALVVGLAAGIASSMFHPGPVTAANGLATADGGKLVVLDPHKWIGHRLPLLPHIVKTKDGKHLGGQLAYGQWIAVFYHASCDECRRAIPVYEALATHNIATGSATHVVFIRVPSAPATPIPPGLFHTNIALHETLDASHQWFATTPIAVKLSGGKVIAVAGGKAAMNLDWLR